MNDWKGILKDVKQISSTGIRTKLGTTPLTMGDEPDFPCCEEAREKALKEIDFRERDFIKRIDCEALYHNIKFQFPDIIESWQKCIQEQANENLNHPEQTGWWVSYLEVQ
tara:strand:- start:127 stop:456 length:330 start_codon:yes stop_codon:yes gene_type:complete